jgi:hypothetical protein
MSASGAAGNPLRYPLIPLLLSDVTRRLAGYRPAQGMQEVSIDGFPLPQTVRNSINGIKKGWAGK